MEPRLLHSVDAGVATVVIHHPARRNAMTPGMWQALPPLLEKLAADPEVRVLVLTGEGGTFCSGADIASLREPEDAAPDALGPPELAVLAEEALAAFPRPTLAAVRGHCVGGGCQLAAACDLRFADENALFGVTPARLGVVYPPGSTRRLVDLVGRATAKYLLLSGELIDAPGALRTGLVNEMLPEGRLGARVTEFAGILASRSQLTQTAAKEFIAGLPHDRGTYPQERAALWAEEARASGETAEGVAAFLERRPPRFPWRPGPPRTGGHTNQSVT
ncbi:enoyl-CoA hydratase/isomerase family protein [Streptomyces sp. TS71-3]|uniref:enoyl-CoA hydratase/isomerase family protein n=1 Tax=Streptomyces sp. TS71-3 TaxID=2733862 RepID=UPI001B11A10C|nr:enoyl-CoA hydratase/isomerase family protein [Streptomyces sp. TS71-3]GHJ41845.1 enoyl-CoA hydratase [Streptomyces sp. TS71-3]